MRTNVVLDDDLIKTALKLSGFKTKKKAIEEGLKLLISLNDQKRLRRFRGKLKWSGDLDKMRTDR
ncbi:MAG: type II toxin-antitoxin system VapB family antitoxin [Sedimentisphaerales bacterium]